MGNNKWVPLASSGGHFCETLVYSGSQQDWAPADTSGDQLKNVLCIGLLSSLFPSS